MYAITIYNRYARRTIAGLAAMAGLSVFLYGAFMLGAVAHAAGRTSAEKEIRTLSSTVSVLENKLLNETKSLSPQRALDMGFVVPATALVTTVPAGQAGLTVR